MTRRARTRRRVPARPSATRSRTRASGGEPKENGREFGESVSDEAQQLVPRPEPQGGPETGEENAQEQETPEPQGSRETGDEAAGTHVPER